MQKSTLLLLVFFPFWLYAQRPEWHLFYKGLTLEKAAYSASHLWFSAENMGILRIEKSGEDWQAFLPSNSTLPLSNLYWMLPQSDGTVLCQFSRNLIGYFNGKTWQEIKLPAVVSTRRIAAVKQGDGFDFWVKFYELPIEEPAIWQYKNGIWTDHTNEYNGHIPFKSVQNGIDQMWYGTQNTMLRQCQSGICTDYAVPDSLQIWRSGDRTFTLYDLDPVLRFPNGNLLIQGDYVGYEGGCGSEDWVHVPIYLVFKPAGSNWQATPFGRQPIVVGEKEAVYFQKNQEIFAFDGEQTKILDISLPAEQYSTLLAADAAGNFWFRDKTNDLIRISPVEKKDFGRFKNADFPDRSGFSHVTVQPHSQTIWLSNSSLLDFKNGASTQYARNVGGRLTFSSDNLPIVAVYDTFGVPYLHKFDGQKLVSLNISGISPFFEKDGTLWFLRNSRIWRKPPTSNTVEYVNPDSSSFWGALLADRQGSVYASGYPFSNHLLKRQATDTWEAVNFPFSDSLSFRDQPFFDLQNRLCVVAGNSFFRYNGQSWQEMSLTPFPSVLYYGYIRFAAENDTTLWAATSNGLLKIGETTIQQIFLPGSTAFENPVYSLDVDTLGNKWLIFRQDLLMVFREGGLDFLNTAVGTGTPVTSAPKVRIFPNPVSSLLRVELAFPSTVQIRVFAADGRSVFCSQSITETGQATLDFSRLAPGIYFILGFNETGMRIFSERVVHF